MPKDLIQAPHVDVVLIPDGTRPQRATNLLPPLPPAEPMVNGETKLQRRTRLRAESRARRLARIAMESQPVTDRLTGGGEA